MAVYFIRNVKTGSYKIGLSDNPSQRLSELQVGNEDELVLELVLPGDQRTEKFLHATCDAKRIRGEWFQGDEQVTALVEKLKLGQLVLTEHGEHAVKTLKWFLSPAGPDDKWLEVWLRAVSSGDGFGNSEEIW